MKVNSFKVEKSKAEILWKFVESKGYSLSPLIRRKVEQILEQRQVPRRLEGGEPLIVVTVKLPQELQERINSYIKEMGGGYRKSDVLRTALYLIVEEITQQEDIKGNVIRA